MNQIKAPDLGRKGPIRLYAEKMGLIPTKGVVKRPRRTVLGRPIKGKVRWRAIKPSKDRTELFYVFQFNDDGRVAYRFHSGQIGFDQNDRLVDALYRTIDPTPILGISAEQTSIVYILYVERDADFAEVGRKFAETVNASNLKDSDLWFAPAGVNRGNDAAADQENVA